MKWKKKKNKNKKTSLKGNITYVCAHTANAAWFFPATIVGHQMLRKNVNVALVDYLCQGFYAWDMCYMRILIYKWNFEKED